MEDEGAGWRRESEGDRNERERDVADREMVFCE